MNVEKATVSHTNHHFPLVVLLDFTGKILPTMQWGGLLLISLSLDKRTEHSFKCT